MNTAQSVAVPTPRRSQARGERTRDRLLVSPRNLFARGGYHGASIVDVALAAGVGVGTVHHHFADKRAHVNVEPVIEECASLLRRHLLT